MTARVNKAALEVLYSVPPPVNNARGNKVALEVLYSFSPPPPPSTRKKGAQVVG